MTDWLLDTFLVTSAMMAIILIIRSHVARIFGPVVAYALWLLPALRLLMPSLSMPFVSPEAPSTVFVREILRDAISVNDSASAQGTGLSVPVQPVATIDYVFIAMTIWLGIGALLFVIQMIRYNWMREGLLADAETISIIDGVKLVASDQVAGPLAFGVLDRYIAVPRNFNATYSLAERELAIAHEMTHHKSGDLYANLLGFIILCLQWFNPIAWLSWNAFRFDQEAACDARVLDGRGAEDRAAYGKALARCACNGAPIFVTALNSPKTIVERLRRLTMKDASKTRRLFGKWGLAATAAIILPMTATIVPAVTASDTPAAIASTVEPDQSAPITGAKEPKIVKVTIGTVTDGKGTGKFTKTIKRDGKTFVFNTTKELSEKEVEQWIEKAEKSRIESDNSMNEAGVAEAEANITRSNAEADKVAAEGSRMAAEVTREAAEKNRTKSVRVFRNVNASAYIPDIEVKEITKNCKNGENVTTDVSGVDGHSKSKVRIVMCGKGLAKIARAAALEGLREARSEIADEEDMPADERAEVLKKIERQIRKLEAEVNQSS